MIGWGQLNLFGQLEHPLAQASFPTQTLAALNANKELENPTNRLAMNILLFIPVVLSNT